MPIDNAEIYAWDDSLLGAFIATPQYMHTADKTLEQHKAIVLKVRSIVVGTGSSHRPLMTQYYTFASYVLEASKVFCALSTARRHCNKGCV